MQKDAVMLKQPQNQSRKYEPLFSDIDEGRIKIPRFQRDFVWTTAQTASLIDSVVKGYPIGTFIFWRTREEMRSIKDIGNIKLPDTPSGDVTLYVLDGQQRITSLYAVRKGVRVTKEGKELDYKRISINLDCDPAGDDQIVTAGPPEGARYISVYELLNGTLAELTTKYQKDSLDKIDIYRGLLRGYDFSTIVIEDYRIDIACDIFTRINTGGTKLTIFEIMMAKTYDQTRDFDLAREFESLVNDDKGKDLEDAGFQTIPESTVLQCIAAHLSQRVSSRDILKLNKSDFIDGWPIMKKGLFAAVDYVRTHLRIPVSLLLPYYALMVPLTYFFIRNGF
jgi:hypothetical protein